MANRHPNTLDPARSGLVVIDMQEKFRSAIFEFDKIEAKIVAAVRGARELGIPILVTEQSPQKLGTTTQAIREALPADVRVVEKTAFSSCGAPSFVEQVSKLSGRDQLVLCGIETHVCVNQTVHDLLAAGKQVHLLEDCVSSRTPVNREIGLAKIRQSGAVPSNVEMALFEWMRDANHERFRDVQKLIK